ncbi:MAG: hypothetical protein U1F10_17025 [Burkholderiales bacterium]
MNRMLWTVALAACMAAVPVATATAAEVAVAPVAGAPVKLADAFDRGAVEVSVYVVPGFGDGRRLRVALKNLTADRLRVTIPAGASALEVGDPLPALYLYAGTARTLSLAPGKYADPVDIDQTGTLRALDGTFWLWVKDGKPQFRGQITTGNVTP